MKLKTLFFISVGLIIAGGAWWSFSHKANKIKPADSLPVVVVNTVAPVVPTLPEHAPEKAASTAEAEPTQTPLAIKNLTNAQLATINQQIANYSAALKAKPDDKVALFGRARLYVQKSYYDNAILDYSALIQQDPKDIRAYFYRALTHEQHGSLSAALADYAQVISLDPKSYATYNNRGLLYLNKPNLEKALDDFNKALTLNPKYAQTYYNRGLTYLAMKSFNEAQQDFTQALALGDQSDVIFHVKILYRLAIAFYNLSKYQDAYTQLNLALKLAPNDSKLYILRALVNDQLGNKEQAFADRSKAQEIGLNSML